MKTFETEKDNIPEGATHYKDESPISEFCWFKLERGHWYAMTKGGSRWYHSGVGEGKIWGIKRMPTQTPEEEEALDLIDTAPQQVESLTLRETAAHETLEKAFDEVELVEWKNGDDCISEGELHKFGCFSPFDKSYVAVFDSDGDCFGCFVGELSKPETPAQKLEREELEAAYDLYCTCGQQHETVSIEEFSQDFIDVWLRIVRKTGYRKGE